MYRLGIPWARKEREFDVLGKTLSHYEIGERLGEGGSGVVYRGRDLRLERAVAIKVLAEALCDDEFAWGRLLREARLASQLNHPHIAAIYDLGEEDGRNYIVMEYVEGLPLADLIPESGMPIEQVNRYARQIAGALAFAHEQGVIHGDIKGSNVIVTSEGNVKLLDFGLGRRIPRQGVAEITSACLPLADAGATAGTLPYLAPELLRGGPTSVQSDLWALGVLTYQMAVGELPFRGATPFEISVEIMVGTPPKLAQLPEPLQSALGRCLEKDPAARLSQARDLVPAGESATRPTPPPQAAVVPASRRGKWWAAAVAVILCAVLLGSLYIWHAGVWRHSAQPSAMPRANISTGNPDPNTKVWVNTNSGTYHCAGTRWYGKTQEGQYMTQKQAQDQGYRPAGKHACR